MNQPLVVIDADGWPDSSTPSSSPAGKAFPFWALLLVWCVPAAIAMVQQATMLAFIGRLGAEWQTVALQFPRWIAWAPLTPVIVRATRKLPFRQGSSGRALMVHLVIAVILISAVELCWTYLSILVEPSREIMPRAALLEQWRPALTILSRLVIGLLTYATVVGVVTALDSRAAIREQAIRSARLETDLAQAQVHALKMQVHPHFLFNTLHAITVLIGTRPDTAREMLVQLGDLLRLTLARAGTAEVPLVEEVDILRRYLDIESVRFGDRLAVTIEIEPAASAALVPHLILQPLVENAIKHGVTSVEGAQTIAIHAKRIAGDLQIEVFDDGPGPPPGVEDGVGLHTVRARLDRLYGSRQSLRLESREDRGCRAVITMPFVTAPLAAPAHD